MSQPGAAVREKFGQPLQLDATATLALVGVSDLAADEVAAFRYPSQEAAEAFAEANRVHYNAPTSLFETPQGWVGIVDLGPQTRAIEANRSPLETQIQAMVAGRIQALEAIRA